MHTEHTKTNARSGWADSIEAPGCAAAEARHNIGRERQTVALRLASPKRANAGKIVLDQADAGHLPLFIAANEPSFTF